MKSKDSFRNYSSFKNARSFVHTLKLNSYREWVVYCKAGKIPKNVPLNPSLYYKKEWVSLKDWLGIQEYSQNHRKFRPYHEAEAFVHKLQLKSVYEWKKYCKSGKKPVNIPSGPDTAYKYKGWTSYSDWLGTNRVASYLKQYRKFDKAKAYVHSLKLKTSAEWKKYSKSSKKPEDIPSNPHIVYKKNWISMGDWLGTGRVHPIARKLKSFEEARAFVRKLGLKNKREWLKYSTNKERPMDIPITPHVVYKYKGWISYGDWLGTGRVANSAKKFRSFDEARAFIRSLNLKSVKDWKQLCKDHKKPDDIPACPNITYKEWISWPHWLGK